MSPETCCAKAIERDDRYPQSIYFVTCYECGKRWLIKHHVTAQLIATAPTAEVAA